jgi:dihydrofolate reductase
MALTVDGKSAVSSSHFPDWTGGADKRMFKEVTTAAGVMIMGSKTFDTIGKPLPGRKTIVLTRNRSRHNSQGNPIFTDKPPQKLIKDLIAQGYQRAILAGGAQINSLFAVEDLIDEIIITFAPKVFGTGLSLFAQKIDLDLELLKLRCLDANTILAHYRIVRESPHYP